MQERPCSVHAVMEETLVNTSSGIQPDSSPVASPSSQVPQSSSPGPAPSGPPDGSSVGQDSGFTSIRDHVAGLGLRDVASRYETDESFVQHLVQQYQAAQQSAQLAPYAQRYLQHANDFESYLSERQRRLQEQSQQQSKKWWSPPEYNPAWSRFVTRDEQGNLALVPGSGATPDILPKFAAYDQYRRDFVERLTHNPEETLTPLIHERAAEVVQHALQQHLGVFQEQSRAKEFLGNNSQWLYQAGPAGGYVRDNDGRMVLSENGQVFASLVYEAEQMGMDTVAKQQRYAARILSAAGRYGVPQGVASPQAPGQPHQQLSQNDQLKQAFLHRPNPAGAIGLSTPTPQPAQSDMQLSLAEILRRNLASGGITDASLAADYR